MTVKKIIIDEDNSGRRLDNYLISVYKSLPKSKIYSIIRKGEVRINSSRAKPSYKLNINDKVRIPPNISLEQPPKKSIDQEIIDNHTNDILYQDSDYIIINKKRGIAVHGGSKNIVGLIDIYRDKFGENIDLCHRIDKDTTGCLVFGQNKQAVKFFNNLLINNKIKKTYTAILKGKLQKNITVDKPIYKKDSSKSKKSISKFIKLSYLKNATLTEIEISTGRSHQIRIHASLIKHPILFDNKYGDYKFNNSFDNKIKKYIALHSTSICFKNSRSKLIDIRCGPPIEFNNLIKFLN
ncbi:MAG: 23S rRNA pseudouridylate synthase [Gammaproteobacteria bacterium]|nr:23S rRNA pseudouridylate synthase [Gammaproteobacteria bacterium]